MPASRDHRSTERPDRGDARGRDGRIPTPWVGRQMWIWGLVMLALALSAAAGVLAYASATHTPPVHSTALLSPGSNKRHTIKTVFLIMMENHNWSDIKG